MDEPPGSVITLLFNTEKTFKSFIKHNKHLVYYVTTRFKNNFKECVITVRGKEITIKLDKCKNETLLLGYVTKNNYMNHSYVNLENKSSKHVLDYCSVYISI